MGPCESRLEGGE
jgi:hypothetical protein